VFSVEFWKERIGMTRTGMAWGLELRIEEIRQEKWLGKGKGWRSGCDGVPRTVPTMRAQSKARPDVAWRK
jgi:hypothetical protein